MNMTSVIPIPNRSPTMTFRSRPMTPAQAVLLHAAKEAREYFDNHVRGTGLNSLYAALTIGRDLTDAIAAVEHDAREAQDAANAAQFEARR